MEVTIQDFDIENTARMMDAKSLKTGRNSEAVMQKEDNDEDKVSIYSSVRLTDSTAGN
jgi:hypothetical protein